MIGILSFGAYIPLWRLSRETIAREWGQPSSPGEKAVANFDEDSITMAVAASINCLEGFDKNGVDGLFFSSTTSPFKEKQAAVVVASASDLRRDIITSDYTNSLRAGTQAMRSAMDSIKAGSAKKILVTAADTRLGAPRSQFEMLFGDGAAALLMGDENVVAEIEGTYSVYHEITDVWRIDGAVYVNAWEDRFIFEEGFFKSVRQTVSEAMKRFGTTPKDYSKAILYAPDFRRHMEIARMLGFDPKTQLQDGYFANVGITGCAHPLLMLIGALENARGGERLLLVSYGDGTDVFSIRVTDMIERMRERKGVQKNIASKQMVPDYATYALWRGIVSAEAAARRPAREAPSSSAQWRERDQIFRLHGAKCNKCGTVQYPPQRVCTKCQTKDNFTRVRLAEKGATLFTYALDYIAGTIDTPHVVSVINFNGGGRMICSMTDRVVEAVKVDMPLDMTFRKLFTVGGAHNYFWKCMPSRY